MTIDLYCAHDASAECALSFKQASAKLRGEKERYVVISLNEIDNLKSASNDQDWSRGIPKAWEEVIDKMMSSSVD